MRLRKFNGLHTGGAVGFASKVAASVFGYRHRLLVATDAAGSADHINLNGSYEDREFMDLHLVGAGTDRPSHG